MPADHNAIVLTLEVTGPEAERLGASSRKEFGAEAATIGRADDNDWVLPHGLVSGHHAVIEYVDGVFYIKDTSTNGVYINSKQNRLPRDRPSPIKSGDSIIIEPFHIQASIAQQDAGQPQFPVLPSDPFRADSPLRPSAVAANAWDQGAVNASPEGDELDPLRLLGVTDDRHQAGSSARAQDLEANSVLADHFRPPTPSPAPSVPPVPGPAPLIPDDYDPALQDREVEAPAPAIRPAAPAVPPVAPAIVRAERKKIEGPREEPHAPAAPSEPARSGGVVDLAAVLEGAGLNNVAVTPQLATHIGEILRVVVSGLMDVLRSRQQIKDEFRMRATRLQPRDNNPLKFSANVSDALHNLLVKRNPAYLGPVEAFEDAFDDLRNHQIAMLAGMRVAFESMFAEFEPGRLQSQFESRVKKKSLLGAGPEVQYWEMYREKVQDLMRDVEATFRDLFGDRFVTAYEEQLDRLKARGRGGKP